MIRVLAVIAFGFFFGNAAKVTLLPARHLPVLPVGDTCKKEDWNKYGNAHPELKKRFCRNGVYKPKVCRRCYLKWANMQTNQFRNNRGCRNNKKCRSYAEAKTLKQWFRQNCKRNFGVKPAQCYHHVPNCIYVNNKVHFECKTRRHADRLERFWNRKGRTLSSLKYEDVPKCAHVQKDDYHNCQKSMSLLQIQKIEPIVPNIVHAVNGSRDVVNSKVVEAAAGSENVEVDDDDGEVDDAESVEDGDDVDAESGEDDEDVDVENGEDGDDVESAGDDADVDVGGEDAGEGEEVDGVETE